ncbi:MAG: FKBP-type peptidyl-prolyl cis-trans isomerase [Alistipes sp.]|nr:FKBP-type peptidyl-prolyl cis-trans isomerase [Alistipes sp.]
MQFKKLFTIAVAALLMTACAKETANDYDYYEDLSLKAWISQHRPELKDNYQDYDKRGYYLDILNAGDTEATPLNDTIRWVRFNLTGRDLQGNIILTRNAREAELAGSFTKYTHYVPYYMYCGDAFYTLNEGTWLAMRKEQKLGAEFLAAKGAELGLNDEKYLLRIGSEVMLYMPSRVTGSVGGDGGYEGQFALEEGKPFIATIEICDTVKNPLQREALDVDAFCKANGGLMIYTTKDDKGENKQTTEVEGVELVAIPTTMEDTNHPHLNENRWVSACDTIAQLYVNHRFDPTTTPEEMIYDLDFNQKVSTVDNKYPTYGQVKYGPYVAGMEPYVSEGSVSELNRKIAEALKERFHSDEPYAGVEELVKEGADSVGLSGKAKIWYIGRFLDGFIFDTNIDEVKEIIYGEVVSKGSALEYTPEEGGLIEAFYYTIPTMRFGQWGALITTSTFGYGASGQNGATSSSSSGYSSSYYDYLNYLNYYNYYNSYYGYGGMGGFGGYGGYGGYYGNYYDSYYGGGYYDPYYSGYYGNYYNSYDTEEEVVTTTTSTEIPSYSPLIFEFYIEPAKE